MPDHINGIRVKIQRAKRHIDDLHLALKRLDNSRPYHVQIRDDLHAGKRIYYLSNDPVIPNEIAAIAGDAIQNLRSALDHLAFALVLVGTKGNIPIGTKTKIYFPIAENATKYMSVRAGQIQGAAETAKKRIDAIEPYGGGKGAILWKLHSLNLTDKHRLLLTIAGRFGTIDLGSHAKGLFMQNFPDVSSELAPLDFTAFFRVADKTFPLKTGDELFIDSIDNKVNHEMKFGIEIALNEPEIAEGEPIHPTLHQMAEFIDELVATFAPEFE